MLHSLKCAGDNEGMILVGPEMDVNEVDMERASEKATGNAEVVLKEEQVDAKPLRRRSEPAWYQFGCEPNQRRR